MDLLRELRPGYVLRQGHDSGRRDATDRGVFYRPLEEGIEIVRILHKASDIARMLEDA
jgi:plasmid stabilization system protein ParE